LSEVFGFLNVDKPYGLTSHDVVGKIRRGLRIKKVGHAGTLDPLATGVLVICLGQATRLSEYVMNTRKRYTAHITLGKSTTTYDAEGDVVAQQPASHITADDIEAILPCFMGRIKQLPPMYSAIKKDGKKLYELARAGETVEIQPRDVNIHNLNILSIAPSESTVSLMLDVECGSGTYIRSLAHDIGVALGVGAYLSDLRRTQSGSFLGDNALTLDSFLTETALSHIPALSLDEADTNHILHGRTPQNLPSPAKQQIARAYAPNGKFLAILQAEQGFWHPHKVFHQE
jgi:tRNA pseudouridine55 synthase